jgi:NitT/TauT family transport system substrate-binding protein
VTGTLGVAGLARAGRRLLRPRLPVVWWVVLVSMVWLLLISGLHWAVNGEHGDREVLVMGYMPVITNLACPILDAASEHGDGVRFEALKFASFAEMAEALRNGHIQAAFIIAPLAVVLRQQGEEVRVVYIGNRHESTLVVRSDLEARSFGDLAGRTLAVPMRYSGHNISAHQLAEEYGARGRQVRIVEMNPPDMASALATGALDAYYVGEPFAMQTVRAGLSRVLLRVEDVWPGFICNLMLVRNDLIHTRPEEVRLLVHGAARAGIWARSHPDEAAAIAARYWNQPLELVHDTLTRPPGRFVFDRFVPVEDELQYMADQMVRFGLSTTNDITGLVDDSFARSADLDGIDDLSSVLP